jgi:hypothetical protein
MSSTALAQDSDILADFRIDPPASTRSGFVTVRERPQVLYDPVPMRIDGIELMPRATAQTIYDSNIFAAEAATGDVALRAIASANAARVIGGTTLRADALIDRRQYLGHGGLSTTDYAIGATVRHTIRRDSLFTAGARAGRETESLTDPSAPLNSRRPSQYDFLSGTAGVARTFGRLSVVGRATLENRRYHDGRDALGNPIDLSFRNRLLAMAEAAAEYELGAESSVFVELSANRRDYRDRPQPEPIRDSSGYRMEAGASFMLTPLIRSRISAGYFRQDFEDSVYPTVSGLAIRGRLDYAVTPLVTLSLTGSRGLEEASTIGTGAFVATRMRLQADYELLRNLILSASSSYERDVFQSVDRRYSIKRAMLQAQYKLSPRLRLEAEYEFDDQDSIGSFPGRDFVRHQVTMGITMQGI